jgi:hypothetical protein
MKAKEKLELMGKVVVINKIMHVTKNDSEHKWTAQPIVERAGWVVGFRTKRNGTYVPSSQSQGYEGDWDYDPAYLKDLESVPCILVCLWPNEKPKVVPMDGFRVDDAAKPIASYYPWSESARRCLSNESKNFPRDAKGRWAKC